MEEPKEKRCDDTIAAVEPESRAPRARIFDIDKRHGTIDVSVILTTSDRPVALACVLEGYRQQTFKDFEIVIGDDGSGCETEEVIDRYGKLLDNPIRHVWLPKSGHGRIKMINAAVRKSCGRYLVLSDADCIPEPDFLAKHVDRRRPGCFLNGQRLMLPKSSRNLTPEQVAAGEHRMINVNASWKKNQHFHRRMTFYHALNPVCMNVFQERLRLMGANVSMWREDYDAVNGFDESYIGWGAADEDLRRRLDRLGLKWHDVICKALVRHYSHSPTETKPRKVRHGDNIKRFDSRCFLTRPLKGLKRRDDLDLLITLAGEKELRHRSIQTSAGTCSMPPDVEIAVISASERRPSLLSRLRVNAQARIGVIAPGTPDSRIKSKLKQWPFIKALILPSTTNVTEQDLDSIPIIHRDAASLLSPLQSGENATSWFERNESSLKELICQIF